MATIPFTFQLRRGTAEQWASKNPVLRAGEPGVETDTSQFKIGDGTSTWAELPYYLSQDAMQIYISEAVANAVPITPEQIDQIANTVEERLTLPDLVLWYENRKV